MEIEKLKHNASEGVLRLAEKDPRKTRESEVHECCVCWNAPADSAFYPWCAPSHPVLSRLSICNEACCEGLFAFWFLFSLHQCVCLDCGTSISSLVNHKLCPKCREPVVGCGRVFRE